MMRRALWVLGGLAWGALSFAVGLYATFPTDAARDRVEYEFTEATGNDYAIDVADLSLWRMSGVDMSGVDVFSLKKGRRTKDNPKPPMERTLLGHFDTLGVRLAFLPLLTGKRAVAFDAGIYDGSISGTYATGSSGVDLDFETSGIDLSRLPTQTEETKIMLVGKIEGEAELSLNTEDVKSSSGSMRFALPGFGLAAGSSVGGFQLPEVLFDKAEVGFEVKDGKVEVTEGTFESSMLSATLSGDITLNKKLARSRNRLELTFTLPEDLDQLAQISPDMKRARDNEGRYHYMISGTVLSPHGRASRTGSRSPAKDRDSLGLGSGAAPDGAGADFDPASSDEERKARRAERIKERRERLRKRREEREAARAAGGDAADAKGGGGDEPPFFDEGGGPEDMPPGMDDGPIRNEPDMPQMDDLPPGMPPEEE